MKRARASVPFLVLVLVAVVGLLAGCGGSSAASADGGGGPPGARDAAGLPDTPGGPPDGATDSRPTDTGGGGEDTPADGGGPACPDGAGGCEDAPAPPPCSAGAGECTSSSTYHVCLPDGSGYGPELGCPADTTCTGGRCLTLCEADIKFLTNVGCQYWSVDLDNDPTHHPLFPSQPTPEFFPHSVVVSNPNDSQVVVTFTVRVSCADGSPCAPGQATCNGANETVCATPSAEYDLEFNSATIAAGTSREFKMPVLNLHGSAVEPKAVRLVASLPVVAYQFNPFDSENAASNDGSLLLPGNALGKLYYAVSLPSRGAVPIMGVPENNGFVTVVGTVANTTVRVTPTVAVIADPARGVPQDGSTPASLAPGVTYEFHLDAYDVLNLEQLAGATPLAPGEVPPDLTGTRIEADEPVAVFSGHQVAGVGEAFKRDRTDEWDTCCTEHLEEQLMPVETWGSAVDCVKSKPRGYEADRWIVVAGDDGVTLHTTPSIPGLDGVTLAHAGDHAQAETHDSFVLTASGRVQVVQFLMSQGQTFPTNQAAERTGDPSMLLVPPSAQYRDEYVILTAAGYSTNWTTVTRPAGAAVRQDGAPIPDDAFEPLGDGTWEYAYREVTTGYHTFDSEAPFGLMVYGYGGVTAYGYPGGMMLEQ